MNSRNNDVLNTCYVATDLTMTDITPSDQWYATTIADGTAEIDFHAFDGKIFRAISPSYFAWLHAKIISARAKYGRKQLPAKQWELLRDRYNAMLDMAEEFLGEDVLKHAIEHLATNTEWIAAYHPPSASTAPGKVSARSTNNQHKKHSLSEIYAMAPGTLNLEDFHVMFLMIDNGTWLPPVGDIKDPFAVQQDWVDEYEYEYE